MGGLSIVFDNIYIYILVFARMAGVIMFNPVFSRRNVPALLKTGIVMCLTVLVAPVVTAPDGYNPDTYDLLLGIMKELFAGFLLGFVFNIFYYMLLTAGDIMDTNFGFSMAKMFDPGTSIQSAFTGSLLNIMFVMYFFVTNSHLILINLAVSSFDFIGIGLSGLSIESAASFAIDVFSYAFNLAMRLTLPFVAAEFILEISMGILMKLIPQIHIFVINFQFKIILALLLLFLLAGPISNFIDNYIMAMFEKMEDGLYSLVVQ